jgi:antitoxin component of RelBE/YafQ-DinJ toxin-antitoxin module
MTTKRETVSAAVPVGHGKEFSDILWGLGGLTPSLVIRTLVLHVVRTGALPEGLNVPTDLKRGRGAIGASVAAEVASPVKVLTDVIGRAKELYGKVVFESTLAPGLPRINEENLAIAFEAIFEGYSNRPYFDVSRDRHIDYDGVAIDTYGCGAYRKALEEIGFYGITYERAAKALKDFASADRREG